MNAINTTEKATNKKSGLKKLGNIILKILLGIGIAAVVIFALVAIYKIIEFLCYEHGFSEERVSKASDRLKNLSSSQGSLDAWF